MLRIVVAVVALACLAGCKSYKGDWMQSQQQLQAAEARIRVLRTEVESRDQAIAERDQAIAARDQAIAARDQGIAERDAVIREDCVAKPKPRR